MTASNGIALVVVLSFGAKVMAKVCSAETVEADRRCREWVAAKDTRPRLSFSRGTARSGLGVLMSNTRPPNREEIVSTAQGQSNTSYMGGTASMSSNGLYAVPCEIGGSPAISC